MARKIMCYSSLKSVFESDLNQYLKYPVITATSGLARVVNEACSSYIGINIGDILKSAVPEWRKSSWKFQCYLQMKRILREYIPQSESEEKVLLSFQRNMNEVMKAILALEEAEIYPDYLDGRHTEYKIFKYIWLQMEEAIPELASMNSAFQYQYTTKEAITKLMNNFLEKEESDKRIETFDKVVLLGFYYITPLQQRFIDGLENAGIEIIFLNCYNSKYAKLYDVWIQNFQLSYQDNKWYLQEAFDEKETDFGRIFIGESLKDGFDNLKIIEYKNDLAFVNDVERILEEKRTLFAVDKREADSILKEFYPEMYKKKHILSYPIGQFIYYLHSMWDDSMQQVCLDMNALKHCFASGWLVVDGIKGHEYIGVLEKIAVYFKDCYTAMQWKERLLRLRDAKEITQMFETPLEGVLKEHYRLHQIVGNPFAKFSVFNESYEDVEKVVKLVLHLIHTAENLFTKEAEINLYVHLERLKEILTAQGRGTETYEEEKVIMQELLNRIHAPSSKTVECFPGDLCDAIQILTGGGFEEENDEEKDNEVSHLSVNALLQVEAFTMSTLGKIHICLCDENCLPGKKGSYPWPISEHFFTALHIPEGVNANRLLKLYQFCTESKSISNRYLFSEALKADDIEVSWISRKDNIDVEKSIYLSLIADASKREISKTEYEQEDIMTLIRNVSEENRHQITLSKDKYLPNEMQMDYLLCPERYYYSYMLERIPSYGSEFQYNFLLSSLIRSFSQAASVRTEEMQRQVFELFPYLRDIEKQQIMDYSHPKKEKEQTFVMDDVVYPNERLEVHFLNKQVKDFALERYNAYEEALMKGELIKLEEDVNLCMYCPHVNYCRKYALVNKEV